MSKIFAFQAFKMHDLYFVLLHSEGDVVMTRKRVTREQRDLRDDVNVRAICPICAKSFSVQSK